MPNSPRICTRHDKKGGKNTNMTMKESSGGSTYSKTLLPTVSDINSWDTSCQHLLCPPRAFPAPLNVVYRSSVTKSFTPTFEREGRGRSVPTIMSGTVGEKPTPKPGTD